MNAPWTVAVLVVCIGSCNRSRSGDSAPDATNSDIEVAADSGDILLDARLDSAVDGSVDTAEADSGGSFPDSCTQIARPAIAPAPPDLPVGMIDFDCRLLERRFVDRSSDYSYLFERRGNTVTQRTERTLNPFVPILSATLYQDGSIAAITRDFIGEVPSAERWNYDIEGRLIRYTQESARERTEITNTWNGDVLVQRTSSAPRFGHAIEYEYDTDGRLQRASGTQGEHSAEVIYSFDDEARPLEIRRVLDDIPVMTQRWDYRGQLTVETTFDPSGRLAGEDRTLAYPEALDVFAPAGAPQTLGTSGDTVAHWENSQWRTQGECALPPSGLGYGYPSHVAHYQLGFPLGERPDGIGFAYNNVSFIDRYGDQSWYGHDGIATPWPAPDYEGTQPVWRVETMYRNTGAVANDQIRLTTMTASGERRVTQDRSFVYETQGLLSDTVSFSTPDAEPFERRLAFAYEDDALVTRRLYEDGVPLAQQRWAHGAFGWTSHEIDVHTSTWGALSFMQIGDADTNTPSGRYYRSFDSEGRVESEESVSATGQRTSVSIRYGADSVVRDTSIDGVLRSTSRETFSDGRLVSRVNDYEADGTADWTETWTYSADGRLLEQTAQAGDTQAAVTTYTWECD